MVVIKIICKKWNVIPKEPEEEIKEKVLNTGKLFQNPHRG